MEVKSTKEEQRENRIKYEKNKGYKLCDNGYIIYNSNENYFKLFGCSNQFIKAQVYFRKFGGEYKVKFLCKKCYKKFKKSLSYEFCEILDEQFYKKPVKLSMFRFDYKNAYEYDKYGGFYYEFI
ncbi:hypothetical protein [Spiroplasma citri]|uniref:Uncharacterized protein n=1 Tax=Spiroplasma citri TaxID=2133 RepID=Q14NE5_SPICI|nr:hypothetical protein [Spiroplasma citri]APE74950.1 hypothetical protein SCITRI_001065 [Spiroplasma citri]QED24892.1 hypothetical protein FRX96_05665 [Spiroplasma citri]QIA67198.1 hypothetical protein GMI18_05875 [Spiroplasma citri]QIA72976.1 hypothetical protein GL982_04760 [Spiroplasma citri]QIA75098.1 hypothetical protein GTU57_05185 [Spiroplasma citri]